MSAAPLRSCSRSHSKLRCGRRNPRPGGSLLKSTLGVVITTAGAARFKEAGIEDLASRFQGKAIRVRGMVILQENRPYIEVDDPDQIEVVG